MAHDMEISFFVDKKSKIFCAGGITEQQTRKVTETQKTSYWNYLFLSLPVSRLAMHLDHIKTSHLNGLGPLEPLEWPKKRFHLRHCHQLCLTKETRLNIILEITNFFLCLFQGWQCTWIISKHPTLMV